mgnify:FL=1
MDTIRQHAEEFIAKREAPAYIANDGKQTPMRGGEGKDREYYGCNCLCRLV